MRPGAVTYSNFRKFRVSTDEIIKLPRKRFHNPCQARVLPANRATSLEGRKAE